MSNTNAERAAALLAAVNDWHAAHPQNLMLVPPQLAWVAKRFPVEYTVTDAGRQALAEPGRTTEESAA